MSAIILPQAGSAGVQGTVCSVIINEKFLPCHNANIFSALKVLNLKVTCFICFSREKCMLSAVPFASKSLKESTTSWLAVNTAKSIRL